MSGVEVMLVALITVLAGGGIFAALSAAWMVGSADVDDELLESEQRPSHRHGENLAAREMPREHVVIHIDHYLRRERALARRFADAPSVTNLQASSSPRAEAS